MSESAPSTTNAPEDARLTAALTQLRSILIDGETLEAWAVQRRIFALTHRRVLIGATSGRMIVLERGVLGGFKMTDVRWQDLRDVKIHVGILSAQLTVSSSAVSDLAPAAGPKVLSFSGLRTEPTQEVYRIAQGQEQAWREKRRVRELEELRARSGGVHIASPAPSPLPLAGDTSRPNDTAARLAEAKRLLDAKLITDSEYETIKARVLANL